MFKNMYEIKIKGHDVKRFVKSLYKRKISLDYISYNQSEAYLKLEKKEYEKLLEIKTIYDIEVVRLYGPIKMLYLLRMYSVFLSSLFLGFIIIIFLSNIIFEIEIVHSSSSIQKLLTKELERYGIEKYHFVKTFNEQEKIVKEILERNNKTLEWLEIERIGTKYKIKVEERIINNIDNKDTKYHLVAKKDGIITKIKSSSGEIVKKIGDYVKEGTIIVSGYVYKDGEVKSTLGAEGEVFAETWYTVDVEVPKYYYEEIKAGKSKYVLSLNFLNKRYTIDFSPYKTKRIERTTVMSNRLLPLSLSLDFEEKTNVIDEVYTIDRAQQLALVKAIEKLKYKLADDAEIIYEKKLKTIEKDSTIKISIFYKVNENITDYIEIVESKEEV